MPNHIANRITGPSIGAIRDILRGKESEIDFNRVIPMPEPLSLNPHSGILHAAQLALRDIQDPRASGIEGMIASLTMANMAQAKSPLEFDDKEWDGFIQCTPVREQRQDLQINGVSDSVAGWARKSGIPATTIYARLYAGWGPEKAVYSPVRRRRDRRAA